MKIRSLLFISIAFMSLQVVAQKQLQLVDDILLEVQNFNYDKSFEILKSQKDGKYSQDLIQQLESFLKLHSSVGIKTIGKKSLPQPIINKHSDLIYCLSTLNSGLHNFYFELEKDGAAMESFEKALVIANTHNFKLLKNEILKAILEYHARYFRVYNEVYRATLDDLSKNAQNETQENIALYYTYFFKRQKVKQSFETDEDYNDYAALLEKDLPTFYEGNILKHLAIHKEYQSDYEASEFLYKESIAHYPQKEYGRFVEKKLAANISYAVLLLKSNRERKAIQLINEVYPKRYQGKLIKWNLAYLKYWKSKAFYQIKEPDSAYNYISQSFLLQMEFDQEKHTAEIASLNIKYQTAEKEKQIIAEKADKERNQNIALGLAALLGLLSIIGVLLYRNTKRKQRIAEQDKALQIQKTEKVLKEKEIETINAMVSGQEKERQRLAGELHDNLGGTLAALKMHINNIENTLRQGESPSSSLSKMNTLLSDAYTQVRGIAHEKNSGVMAKNGLLPAIQKLADTISSSQGLQIEVQDYGLEERLSNDLEITIFRIIQELITNIIKHAGATEATISLTQHDKELNIIVEDNGRGFKVGKLSSNNGMGLGSIERRVEHLEGTMAVDSSPGKGTNIIIDIPL